MATTNRSDALKLHNSLAVKMTLWFLLLAILSAGLIIVFVRRTLQETIYSQGLVQSTNSTEELAFRLQSQSPQSSIRPEESEEGKKQQILFVVDQSGQYIAHSDTSKIGESLRLDYPETVIEAILGHDRGVVEQSLTSDIISFEAIPSQDMVAVTVIPEAETLRLLTEFDSTAYPQVFVALAILALMGGAGTWATIRTIRQITSAAQQIAIGELHTRVDLEDLEGELEILGINFNMMAEQLQHLFENLEQRVAARTRDLQIAANVSSHITTILNPDELLPQIVNQTREGYDLYHVSVFLFNSESNTLNLNAGVGRQISDTPQGTIKFNLDDQGIVPKAARSKVAVVENDVSESSAFHKNSLLPDTQSELSIPMLVGQRLIGVLDLQSEEKNRFDAGDVQVFTTLATQIGIAVENAQSYTEAAAARHSAEKANEVKSLFLASMSHELRTPLNSVINFTKFVIRGVMGPVTERQEETLNKVVASGQHLLALINDVLDMSKIESGSLNLFIEDDLQPNEIFESVINSGESLLNDKAVELRHDIQADLPVMSGDRKRITQIMLNIVSNACKFTEEGFVKITAKVEDDYLLVSVEDSGPGIAAEDSESVFSSFRQTNTGLRQGEGTGLGMPISKSLAEAHGGKLWFESEVGKGSTFYVKLPVQYEKTLVIA